MSIEHRNFDLAAEHWDERPQRVQLAQEIADAILQHIPDAASLDVLDFGCGTGLLTLQLQPLVHSITGVDSSSGMLKVLNDKIANLKLANARTVQCNIEQGEILPGKYDLIVSSMTFHHVREIEPLLGQLHRVLALGGRLCVADLDQEGGRFHEDNTGVFHFGFDRKQLQQSFSRAGFSEINVHTATQIVKPDSQHNAARFSVFLLTGLKG
ncbi:MAG: class I SAM-dependent methyltransferase [Desulfobulbus sp.]|nr:class I SAM-dependent methyltransferase [Desulfobulbus sp.]